MADCQRPLEAIVMGINKGREAIRGDLVGVTVFIVEKKILKRSAVHESTNAV